MQSSFSKHTNNNCHCIWYKTQFKEIKRGWASKGMTSTRWSFVPRPMTIILLGNNHFLIGRGGGWDFHCAWNFFFLNLPQSKYFFLLKTAKNCFLFMWNKNTFFHKNNTLTTQIQQCNIFFSNWWQHNFFFSYNEKIYISFRSARALKKFFSRCSGVAIL